MTYKNLFITKLGRLFVWSFKGNLPYAFGQFRFTNAVLYFFLHLLNARKDKFKKKAVIFNLGNGGLERYMFNLISTYKLNGYAVLLNPSYSFYATCGKGFTSQIFSFLNVNLLYSKSQVSSYEVLHVVNFKAKELSLHNLQKTLNVSADDLSGDESKIVWPFSFHPNIYIDNALKNGDDFALLQKRSTLKENRKYSIFFGGQVNHEMYGNLTNNFPHLINRNELFQILFKEYKDYISSKIDVDASKSSGVKPIIILDKNDHYIEPKNWFEVIGDTNFFICPPGFEMPMCHNVIEAMACGAIPIIQYTDYFHPKLMNDHNCLSFRDEREFVSVIEKALEMPSSLIAELRRNVLDYFKFNLDPKQYIAKIESNESNRIECSIIAGKYSLNHMRNSKRK